MRRLPPRSTLFPYTTLFFFNDTATTEIYTLSLHDALPIYPHLYRLSTTLGNDLGGRRIIRSEEHTSELQSHSHLVCRLLLEKKHKIKHHLGTLSHPCSARRQLHHATRP